MAPGRMAPARRPTEGRELTATVDDPEVRHLFSAIEAEKWLGIKASTVRSWARRELVYSFGLNERNHPMYDRRHLLEMRDKRRSEGYNHEMRKASSDTNRRRQ